MAPPGDGRLTQICRLPGHEECVWCVAWRPGAASPQLTSVSSDRRIRVWGPRAGAALDAEGGWTLLAEMDASERHGRTLRSLAWDPSGDVLAVTSFDATTSLWREAAPDDERGGLNFECAGMVSGHENEVKCAAFSPSGDYLATCSRDKSVWIFETDKSFEYECVSLLQSHTQDVKFLRWHPSQDVLFSCSYDDSVKVWAPDGDDWSCKETLVGHESTVWCLSFDPVGARFATCSDDRTLRIWAPGAAAEGAATAAAEAAEAKAKAAPTYSVSAAAFIAPIFRWGSVLPAAPAPAAPTVDEASSVQKEEEELRPPADASCAWHCVSTIRGEHPRPIYSIEWLGSPTGWSGRSSIATACGDNHVRVFQPVGSSPTSDWACVADVEAHAGDANCIAWYRAAAPDGAALLASCGDDGDVVVWRFAAA